MWVGLPSKIHTNQERRKTCVNTSFWGYSNAFASKVHFERFRGACFWPISDIYIYNIYICIYTYLPCMSACFGLVCISHQFFRWSQGLFGVRTAVLAASSEVHPDVCYRGMVRRWAYHIKTECETGSNHGKGAITAKKKTIAPKYLLRQVFWFERYLSVFDLSIRSHLHLQGEVRSFAPILPSQQQLTGRSKRLDSMV